MIGRLVRFARKHPFLTTAAAFIAAMALIYVFGYLATPEGVRP